jgi:probable HAF family extracellular repeat protein
MNFRSSSPSFFRIAPSFLCGAVLLISTNLALANRYSVVDLGLPSGTVVPAEFSEALDVNESGQVAVGSWGPGGFAGFLWENNQRTVLETNSQYNAPTAMNNHGQIIGYYSSDATESNGFLWDNGVVIDLGHVSGGQDWTRPLDINDDGLIVGFSNGGQGNQQHAFTWHQGQATDLGIVEVSSIDFPINDIVWRDSAAARVTNSGLILGYTSATLQNSPNATVYRGWVLNGTELITIPVLPGDMDASFFPRSIDEAGNVLGWYYEGDQTQPQTAVWQRNQNQLNLLPALTTPEITSLGNDMNSSGTVIGTMPILEITGATYTAISWDGPESPSDLNSMLDDSGAGWNLEVALAINDRGWIVGKGTNPNGDPRGYLLVPVPEPSSLALLSGCILLVFNRTSKRECV